MRFVYGPVPASRTLDARRAGWNALSEPDPGRFAVQALLLTVPFLVGSLYILLAAVPLLKASPLAVASLLGFFVAMVPLHELTHALAYPGGLASEHLVAGAWLRRGMFYVLYDSPLPRRRVLVMLAAPLAVFTALLGTATLASDEWRPVFGLMLLVHTAACTGDFLTSIRILAQVPSRALVHNDGWQTYWSSAPRADA